MAVDRLSSLPDDLLIHILSFVPAREAAASTVLSRRWRRPLWLQTGAINVDTRSYLAGRHGQRDDDDELIDLRRSGLMAAFFRDAETAMATFSRAGGGAGLRKMSLFVEVESGEERKTFLRGSGSQRRGEDRVGDLRLLAGAAACRLEELRLEFAAAAGYRISDERNPWPAYSLYLCHLACAATLRVLDLTDCLLDGDGAPPSSAAAVALPRLELLRLRRCALPPKDLQSLFDGAPRLSSAWLEDSLSSMSSCFVHLHSPAITSLTVIDCPGLGDGTELDAPRLRSFFYRGRLIPLSVLSPMPALTLVDLCYEVFYDYDGQGKWFSSFWGFLDHFCLAKVLKLKVDSIDLIVVDEEGDGILVDFPVLQHLELDGTYEHESKVAKFLSKMLSYCPVIRELRLKFRVRVGYEH